MDRLAIRFRVVAPDLYGYGQSPPWSNGRSLTLADEIRLLEPAFRAAGDRFHLVGHSYGGAIALLAALARPERILSLSLFEPVLFSVLFSQDPAQPGAREIAAVSEDTTLAVERNDLDGAAERFVDYWMGKGAWANTPEKRRPSIASGMRKVKAEWGALCDEPTSVDELSRLSVPTLFMVGTESPASTRGIAGILTGALPQVTRIDFDGVGHMAPVTHADRINAVIDDYIGGITPGQSAPRA